MMTFLDKLELNMIYPFPVKAFGSGQYLTAEGVAYVRAWIRKNVGDNVTTTVIQEQIGVEHTLQSKDCLIVQKGFGTFKNSGKFPIRVKKWAYETRGVTLDPLILSQLGSALENHFIGGKELYFDLYPTIDWDSGVFGEKIDEGGSCWWTQGWVRRVRPFMPDEMLALRVFKKLSPKDNYDGPTYYNEYAPVGRCWVFTPLATGHNIGVLFNAYGPNLLHLAAQFAHALFGDVEGSYRQISLSCNPLPINSNLGIAVGDPALLSTIDRIRLDNWIEERCEICRQEGRRRVGEYRADFSAREVHFFCPTHFNELVVQTYEGFYAWRNDCEQVLAWLHEFHTRRQTIWLSEEQMARFPVCDKCGHRYSAKDMRQCPCERKQAEKKAPKKYTIFEDPPAFTATSSGRSYLDWLVSNGLTPTLEPAEIPFSSPGGGEPPIWEVREATSVADAMRAAEWQMRLDTQHIEDIDSALQAYIRERFNR